MFRIIWHNHPAVCIVKFSLAVYGRWEGQQGGCKLNNVETAVTNFSFVFPYTARFD